MRDKKLLKEFEQARHVRVESTETSRRVTSVNEWDAFVKELRTGIAKAVGYKWFPYTAGGTLSGPDREVEVEAWFEHPGSRVGRYLVVHVHFASKWEERHTDPEVSKRVTAVNIRHTQSSSSYWAAETLRTYGTYAEGGGGHFRVAGFHRPWDRKDLTAQTRAGTSLNDVAVVLTAAFGSDFYFGKRTTLTTTQ